MELAKSKKMIQAAKKKEKAAYGNMFSKISVYNDKEVPVATQLSSASNSKVHLAAHLSIVHWLNIFIALPYRRYFLISLLVKSLLGVL